MDCPKCKGTGFYSYGAPTRDGTVTTDCDCKTDQHPTPWRVDKRRRQAMSFMASPNSGEVWYEYGVKDKNNVLILPWSKHKEALYNSIVAAVKAHQKLVDMLGRMCSVETDLDLGIHIDMDRVNITLDEAVKLLNEISQPDSEASDEQKN